MLGDADTHSPSVVFYVDRRSLPESPKKVVANDKVPAVKKGENARLLRDGIQAQRTQRGVVPSRNRPADVWICEKSKD